ncbi:hypothetical protein PIB30_079583 [Stylosanthes scabra]|uniref:Uncharacterized protein n=1 Tax=Stylosanthes scabra TaxID=79078 RepID=A0ABU6TRK2_9FABA|nr:hypothetical protein [Stylosanthes scabra]
MVVLGGVRRCEPLLALAGREKNFRVGSCVSWCQLGCAGNGCAGNGALGVEAVSLQIATAPINNKGESRNLNKAIDESGAFSMVEGTLCVVVIAVSAFSTISAFSPYSVVALLLLCFSRSHVYYFVLTVASLFRPFSLNLLVVTTTGIWKIVYLYDLNQKQKFQRCKKFIQGGLVAPKIVRHFNDARQQFQFHEADTRAKINLKEIGGMDVYNFIHMVFSVNGEEENNACLGEDV